MMMTTMMMTTTTMMATKKMMMMDVVRERKERLAVDVRCTTSIAGSAHRPQPGVVALGARVERVERLNAIPCKSCFRHCSEDWSGGCCFQGLETTPITKMPMGVWASPTTFPQLPSARSSLPLHHGDQQPSPPQCQTRVCVPPTHRLHWRCWVAAETPPKPSSATPADASGASVPTSAGARRPAAPTHQRFEPSRGGSGEAWRAGRRSPGSGTVSRPPECLSRGSNR